MVECFKTQEIKDVFFRYFFRVYIHKQTFCINSLFFVKLKYYFLNVNFFLLFRRIFRNLMCSGWIWYLVYSYARFIGCGYCIVRHFDV